MRIVLAACLLVFPLILFGQFKKVVHVSADSSLTFWAISAVDEKVVWIAANNGTVGRSTNGGLQWAYRQMPGFEKKEFRTIYAFDEKVAIVANVGTPACILRTVDGGENWEQVYRNDSPEAFIDGVDFWNDREGMIYGDPIDGHMLLARTADGGRTWQNLSLQSRPALNKGEASFASSGTGIRCLKDGRLVIATGGTVSRIFTSANKGETWQSSEPMLRQGSATGGIFSIAFDSKGNSVLVGGDFQDSVATELAMYRNSGGDWQIPKVQPAGTRWCVEFVRDNFAVAAGPSGVDCTTDGGNTWSTCLRDPGCHVVRKSRKGELVIAAGRKGFIALLK